MPQSVNAEIKKNSLVITIPMCEPRLSSSGKNMVVATTGGFAQTSAMIKGKPVSIAINAITKP